MYKVYPKKRYKITLDFLERHCSKELKILDLGVQNPLSKLMKEKGFQVENTQGTDLDDHLDEIITSKAEVVTAFEILEHLLAPYPLLKAIQAEHLFISVPLKLWFASAYRSKTDARDRHFHEFEDWQLDWLLEKSGWKIIDRIKFSNPVNKIGLRPLLRKFTPRYYLVYAARA
ncbi:MAG: methyltransferase [Flavobacteriaceae bacterium]|nr:methyltransferase [Flavobacteriaceae bacterium]